MDIERQYMKLTKQQRAMVVALADRYEWQVAESKPYNYDPTVDIAPSGYREVWRDARPEDVAIVREKKENSDPVVEAIEEIEAWPPTPDQLVEAPAKRGGKIVWEND